MRALARITPESNGDGGRARRIARGRSPISAAPAGLLKKIEPIQIIRCDEVQWRFLGLSLAGYNVLISLALAAIAAWGALGAYRTMRDAD